MSNKTYELDTKRKRRSWNISKTDTGRVLSKTTYNALLGGMLIYGFLANAITCKLFTEQISNMNPIVLTIMYLVAGIGGICMANISQNIGVRFIGYNLLVVPSGMIIASVLPAYHFGTVMHALIGTALIATIMLVMAIIRPKTFEGLAPALLLSLISAIIVEFALLMIFKTSSIFIDIAVLIIMAMFTGYDFVKANTGMPTANNAVAFAMDLYLDILNIFIRLLSIIGHKN